MTAYDYETFTKCYDHRYKTAAEALGDLKPKIELFLSGLGGMALVKLSVEVDPLPDSDVEVEMTVLLSYLLRYHHPPPGPPSQGLGHF